MKKLSAVLAFLLVAATPAFGQSASVASGACRLDGGAGCGGLVPVMVGDSGSGGTAGAVPAPATGDATKFLKGDGTWASIPGGGDALTTSPLSQFASTTSAQLAGVLSDETGSGGGFVRATSPTLTTPNIGAATATSVNGTTIPASKTLVVTTDKLSVLAATTSSELAGVLSDETGSGGGFVRATSPTISGATMTTSLNVPHGTLASIPATCVAGDVYAATDQTAGLVWYLCTATNTWTLVSPAGNPFSDAGNLFFANGDATKLGKFDLSGITTGTTRTWTWPNASGTVTLLGNSSTGSGNVVLATSPSLTTPSLGVATATSINSTTIPSSKTLVTTTDNLSALASTTSAQLAGVVSDEVGSGSAVFATKAQAPYLRGRIASQISDVTVANTTTETSLLTGTMVGTNSIAANSVYAGETISLYASGYVSNTGTPTVGMNVKLGSTTVLTTSVTSAAGLSNTAFVMRADCTVRSTGASGTVICAWHFRSTSSSQTNSTQTTGAATSTSTIDFTSAVTPGLTLTWGAASTSNTFTLTQYYLERM